jgi:hypothetical protein
LETSLTGVQDEALYVRYESPEANWRGHHPGVFALIKGLHQDGVLTEAEERFVRTSNDWYNASYTDPSSIDPHVYDRELHPLAAAWFKSSSTHLVDRIAGYIDVLAAHGVDCVASFSDAPGVVIYEDDDQVIAEPV